MPRVSRGTQGKDKGIGIEHVFRHPVCLPPLGVQNIEIANERFYVWSPTFPFVPMHAFGTNARTCNVLSHQSSSPARIPKIISPARFFGPGGASSPFVDKRSPSTYQTSTPEAAYRRQGSSARSMLDAAVAQLDGSCKQDPSKR